MNSLLISVKGVQWKRPWLMIVSLSSLRQIGGTPPFFSVSHYGAGEGVEERTTFTGPIRVSYSSAGMDIDNHCGLSLNLGETLFE